MRNENEKKCLIYCPIFRDELRAVLNHADSPATFELGYEVHSHPDRMLKQLKEGILESQRKGMIFSILTGKDCECDVPIAELAHENNGCVPDHMNCFEIFLGREKTRELQKNRTVLMTPGWMQMIRHTLAAELWRVEDARMSLGWYDRILLLNSHVTEISDDEIIEFYDLIQVPIEMMDIDLDHFRRVVEQLIRQK